MSPGLRQRVFYGWIIVATLLVIGTTMYGVRYSFGVFFKSIEAEFSLSRAATSMVYSLYLVLGSMTTIVVGWALDKYGPKKVVSVMALFTGLSLLATSRTTAPWQLYLTYSVLLAIGSGATFTMLMSNVSRWFDKKRGMALGIANSGGGLGTLAMAPIAATLIATFDWRQAYIILGVAVWVIVIPLTRLLKRTPQEIGALPDGAKAGTVKAPVSDAPLKSRATSDLSLPQAVRTASFWLIMVSWLGFASNLFFVLTHIVPHASDIGLSPLQSAGVLSLIGGMAIPGSISMGAISDRIGRKSTIVICVSVQALAIIWLMWSRQLWMLYVFAVVFGFSYGGASPAFAAQVSDTFGLSRLGSIFGGLDLGFGLGAAIGPAIGGWIFDTTHSYLMAFVLGVVELVIVAVATGLVRKETARTP